MYGEPVDRWITGHDLKHLGLPLFAVAAWVLPGPAWEPVSRAVSAFSTRIARAAGREGRCRVPAEILEHWGLDAGQWASLHKTTEYLELLQLMRVYRPWGGTPDARLSGREHLEAAQAGGRGAILWVAPFRFGSLVTKVGAHGGGVGLVHLSRPTHGFSPTRLGRRFLNPIRCRAEDRFLEERVVIDAGGPAAAMRKLRERLREGKVVSILLGPAPTAVEADFFDSRLAFPTGPLSLAASAGVEILPVFPLPAGLGRFEIRIGAPLALPRDGSRDYSAAARDYARRLEEVTLAYPGVWNPWGSRALLRERGAG
jgi:hypothetical protein